MSNNYDHFLLRVNNKGKKPEIGDIWTTKSPKDSSLNRKVLIYKNISDTFFEIMPISFDTFSIGEGDVFHTEPPFYFIETWNKVYTDETMLDFWHDSVPIELIDNIKKYLENYDSFKFKSWETHEETIDLKFRILEKGSVQYLMENTKNTIVLIQLTNFYLQCSKNIFEQKEHKGVYRSNKNILLKTIKLNSNLGVVAIDLIQNTDENNINLDFKFAKKADNIIVKIKNDVGVQLDVINIHQKQGSSNIQFKNGNYIVIFENIETEETERILFKLE